MNKYILALLTLSLMGCLEDTTHTIEVSGEVTVEMSGCTGKLDKAVNLLLPLADVGYNLADEPDETELYCNNNLTPCITAKNARDATEFILNGLK